MKDNEGRIRLSASDLMHFIGCVHATTLDLAHVRGIGPKPSEHNEDAALLQKQGNSHEAAHLRRQKVAGRSVVEIDRRSLEQNAIETRRALATGPDVVFQGAFLSSRWGGWSDFLERVEKPSALGQFSYEVTDTKLKRRAHPKHLMQLVIYSDLLTEVQGVAPEFAHVELGNGTRATLRLSDYEFYARLARSRLEDFIENPKLTRPIPCTDCGLCRWSNHCATVWSAEDSLFNVAGISRSQVKKLEEAGVKTMEGLASLTHQIQSITENTRLRLTTQARLQHARKTSNPSFELRDPEIGKGFDLLPEPQPGDIFYDIEGDPHFEGGLEYLHGVWFDGQFRAFWGHDHIAETAALRELLDFFRARLTVHPAARIYHYAAYEITALRRLTTKYGVGEAFLDRLLRERRFVDLFAVVRGALIGSEPNYSIKSMEAFYGRKRDGEVKTAGGSVVAYERWRETGDQQILDEIEDYNRVDCISTQELRDWLVGIRPAGYWPSLGGDASSQETEEDVDTQALRSVLRASGMPTDRQDILFNLGLFHKREAKPAQWKVFDSMNKDEDGLIDDLDALAGLIAVGDATPIKRSLARTYHFPQQETKLRAGKKVTIPVFDGVPATISIESFDQALHEITIKVGAAKSHLLTDRLTLHPDWPLNTDVIATAIRDVIADQCTARQFTAVDDLLSRIAPRLTNGPQPDLLNGFDAVNGVVDAVGAMDGTVLPIQGPPGTGKTYVAARAILSLVRKGYRVGVASNSHEAIRNVLMACLEAIDESGANGELEKVDLTHKVNGGEDGYPKGFIGITRVTSNDAPSLTQGNVVGGTAFFFSRPEVEQSFDWLFVDEAGQIGLANMVAMGRAARNIVLVGDPRQLPQVVQAAHPEPANLSCLDWLLGDNATVPPDRGIFLPISRRMHSHVCKFVSNQFYEGRLVSHPDTNRQRIVNSHYPEAGVFFVSVNHEGNTQIASEEVAAINEAIKDLLSGTWMDKSGNSRLMKHSDIIVVAPYNAQVNALRDALPDGIRVGTVDRFQGQEAAVCVVSMTASSTEETPRGMEFLSSLNRMNVAISRAMVLALVFGSPRLREAKCETIEQMHLINTLCALEEIKIDNNL